MTPIHTAPGRAIRPAYTRAELRSDAIVHIIGLSAVVVAVPVLICVTALVRGDAAAMVGASIYGATLVAMLVCSALYNMVRRPGWTAVLRRLDHSAIYLKIAGTYTPFTLMSGRGLALTAILWIAAAGGTMLKMLAPLRFRWLGLALYVGMGWAGIFAGGALFAGLATPVVILIGIGGMLYTIGIVWYLWERIPHHNTIWHVFVLAASMVFYAAVTVQVVVQMPG